MSKINLVAYIFCNLNNGPFTPMHVDGELFEFLEKNSERKYWESVSTDYVFFQFMRLKWLLLYVNLAKFQDFSNRQGNFLWYFTPLLLVQWCELPKRMYSLSSNADQQVGLCHSSIRTWRYFTSDLLWNIFLCNK